MCISAKTHPIWFSSHKERGISVRYVISPFHPSFYVCIYINHSKGVWNSPSFSHITFMHEVNITFFSVVCRMYVALNLITFSLFHLLHACIHVIQLEAILVLLSKMAFSWPEAIAWTRLTVCSSFSFLNSAFYFF